MVNSFEVVVYFSKTFVELRILGHNMSLPSTAHRNVFRELLS